MTRPDFRYCWMMSGFNAFVLGPAFGVGERARSFTGQLAGAKRRIVLDADGLTSFRGDIEHLCSVGAETELLMTPHQGEFTRLFPDLMKDSRLSKVDRATVQPNETGAVVLYKGLIRLLLHLMVEP